MARPGDHPRKAYRMDKDFLAQMEDLRKKFGWQFPRLTREIRVFLERNNFRGTLEMENQRALKRRRE